MNVQKRYFTFIDLVFGVFLSLCLSNCDLQRTVKVSSLGRTGEGDVDGSSSQGNKSGSGAGALSGRIGIDFSGTNAPRDANIVGAYAMKYDAEYLAYSRYIFGSSGFAYQKSHLTEAQKCPVDCSRDSNDPSCNRDNQCVPGTVQFSVSFCAEDKQATCVAPELHSGTEYTSLNLNSASLPYLGYFSISVCETRNGRNDFYHYSADPSAVVPANYSVNPFIPSRTGHQGSLDFSHFSADLTEDNPEAIIGFKLKDGYFVENGVIAGTRKSFRATVTASDIQIFPQSPPCIPR